jgi:YegS/Rv2252/BmrU family lipid kinase
MIGMLPASRTTTVAVVVNAASRRGLAAMERLRRLLDETGLRHAELYAATSGDRIDEVLDQALASRPDVLVVGGGDGTVSCAAAKVAGTKVALGVLPLGTANDFARTLEVPTELAAATRILSTGKVVDVDLGWVRSQPGGVAKVDPVAKAFLNVASIGLSVGVTEKLTPGLKKRLGPLAYPIATLAAYRHHRPFSARLEFPDGDHEPVDLDDLLQVAVGNGRHYGGGNAVSPSASLDDHMLDVYAIVRGRLRDHVSIARFLKDGSFVDHDQVHHVRTRRIRVQTGPALPVNLDGEVAAVTPADFEIERNAVHVIVHPGSEAATLDGSSD